ncbi:MAG: hypothetical protein KJN62_02555 [Deltaproteobacteria bacterium]|nr:hypothetical protein [Deltaproteobacteria bacterium]
MQRSIHAGINFILKRLGFILQDIEKEWERGAFAKLYETRINDVPYKSEYPAECIVFSRDRSLQLHALLASYSEKKVLPIPLHVLYHSSTSSHQKAYEEVIKIFSNDYISFIKQDSDTSFRKDLLSILATIRSDKTFFLVDDVVFIEDFDIRDFAQFDTDKFVPTLRMGLNLCKCYTLQQEQPLPELQSNLIADDDKTTWKWNDGVYDWSYPLSVDGHLFSTQEIRAMTELIDFSAPNTYEDQLQRFRRFFSCRLGVGYRKSKIVNIPCNKVQTENKNLYGNVHQDYLLEQWHKGFQMDYRRLYGYVNESAHQEISFEFKNRDETL